MSAAAETLPCDTCRTPVDPLRAPRVAHFDDRFCYFCSPECEERFRSAGPAAVPAPRPAPERLLTPLPAASDASETAPEPAEKPGFREP
jgi:YHS domain-containing protein